MKKTDFLKQLSELTKIDVETMTKAFASEEEEIDIEIPKLHIFTDEEINARDLNKSKAGNHTAVEMAVKDARNKLVEQYGDDFNFQGKTIENLLDTAIKAGEKKAGVKPNEKVAELEGVNEKLRNNVITLEQERDQALQDKDSFKFDYGVNSTLVSKVPHVEDSTFSADEYVALWKRDKEIITSDGVITYKINGEIARDSKTQTPISIESGFETFLNEKGVTKKERNGRGGGDYTPPGTVSLETIKTTSDFDKYCNDNEITSLNDKKAVVVEVLKKNPSFVLGQS